jgi:hypothetical protein
MSEMREDLSQHIDYPHVCDPLSCFHQKETCYILVCVVKIHSFFERERGEKSGTGSVTSSCPVVCNRCPTGKTTSTGHEVWVSVRVLGPGRLEQNISGVSLVHGVSYCVCV